MKNIEKVVLDSEMLKLVQQKRMIGNLGSPLNVDENLNLIGCLSTPVIVINNLMIDNFGAPVIIKQ